MLTNEKVLEVFADYLSQETEYEIVESSRGYVLLAWENPDAISTLAAEQCPTPESLRDELLKAYENLLEYNTTQGKRDLDAQEERDIESELNILREKCNI